MITGIKNFLRTTTLAKKVASFMTKELRKAIMNRSILKNKFLKTRNLIGVLIAKKVSVLACSAKLKDVYLGKLDHRVFSDIEKFGKFFEKKFNAIKKYKYHPSIKKLNISWVVKIHSSLLV